MPNRLLCERHCSDNPSRWKPREPATVERAKALLASSSQARRKQGMQMLRDLKEEAMIVEFALKERSSEVLSVASEAIDRPPPELVRHFLTQPSSDDATLYMRFHVALDNFLYAEDDIYNVYRTKRNLNLDVIEGIGLAQLRSLGQLLHRYADVPLELYHDALRHRGWKAVAGVDDFHQSWSRAGWAAIKSAVALARLGAIHDHDVIARLLEDAERLQRQWATRDDIRDTTQAAGEREMCSTKAQLTWCLFDAGDQSKFGIVMDYVELREGATDVLRDLATSLLKRGEIQELRKLAQHYPHVFFVGVQVEFCYWPLVNWCDMSGAFPPGEFSSGCFSNYRRARESGIAPPPWWTWQ